MAKIYIPLLNIILLLSLIYTPSSAQEIKWQKTIGGSSGDVIYSIQQTKDGGYILGGNSISNISGDKTENCLGNWDYWIVKVDSFGNVEWENTIGGNSADMLNTIQQTTDGGYILGGDSDSEISGDKTEKCSGIGDYWIVKVDSIGNIQWQNAIRGFKKEHFGSIQQTFDGGYILGGYSNSNIGGDKSENNMSSQGILSDYWIVKIDSIGNIQWENTIGGNDTEYLFCIIQTSDSGYILGGLSGSNVSGDKTEGSAGSDYWVVKTDSMGIIQWQNTIGGNEYDYLYTIKQTHDGGYILGGESISDISIDKTEKCYGDGDFWIVKTDSIGNIQWDNTIGGDTEDEISSLIQTADKGYLLGGFSHSKISGEKTENVIGWSLSNDFWVIKIDSMGNIQWQNAIGGNGSDALFSVQQTADGDYILGGSSTSSIYEDKTENSLGGSDFWIVKITDKFNFISGRLFADLNSNGIQDSAEFSIKNLKITEQSTGRFSFSDQNGKYRVSFIDSGNFNVSPQLINWYSPAPVSHSAIFTGILQTDSLNDFAFQPQGIFEDVFVTITPLGNFRSGFTASYMINYGNYGTTTVAPTVYFYPYSNVTYQSATLTPSNITPDSVVWNLPALTPFQTGSIIVTVNINLGLSIGTLINSSAHVEPFLTDYNPSNNNSNWEVLVTGSFDPNDILVSLDRVLKTELTKPPFLDYIIRFQNTGNDTAFTVKILNPIDTNRLDISSVEFVNASHPVNVNWVTYQRNMEFNFDSILLPDSNTNEPLSHGFVHYRIKPKSNLLVGYTILNFAAIYFDFNEPIMTNFARTYIVLPTGIGSVDIAPGKLHVFPNPTENTLYISGIHLENGKAQLRLMDIYGKLILEKTITSITTTLETNNLSSGIYLIQSGELRATFVKQ